MGQKSKDVVIFWFRRDLRLEDNRGLSRALKWAEEHGCECLPLFIFDSQILSKLEDRDDARVGFIHAAITQMQGDLRNRGSEILCLEGAPLEVWGELLQGDKGGGSAKVLAGRKIRAVFCNGDYEPYARKRDERVRELCGRTAVEFYQFKDQVIFEKGEVAKDDLKPYTVYTPYSKKWLARLSDSDLKPENCSRSSSAFWRSPQLLMLPTLKDLGFQPSKVALPSLKVETAILTKYAENRNTPSMRGTSRLGLHLRFGTVSIRKLVAKAQELRAETWLKELIWREFFMQILWHFPHVTEHSFRPEFDRIHWRHDEVSFKAWCEGKTGVPIVDAGMRELNATGFMHNRVRMIVGSYLTKHLLIDWRWGEAYFARKLLDFDLAANNGNWQWVAGTGCDAAPYFRIFNPTLQAEKFDPKNEYIETWVPEYKSSEYPAPIVDHKMARERALAAYSVVKGEKA